MRTVWFVTVLMVGWLSGSSAPWHWSFLVFTLPLGVWGFVIGQRMAPLSPEAKVKEDRLVCVILLTALVGLLVARAIRHQPTQAELLRQLETNDWRKDWQTNVVPKEVGP